MPCRLRRASCDTCVCSCAAQGAVLDECGASSGMDLDCTRLVVLSLEVEDCQRFVNPSPLALQSFTHSDCELPVHQATRPSESLNGMEPPPPIPPLMLQQQQPQQQQQSQAFGEPQHQEQQPQPFATPDQVGVAVQHRGPLRTCRARAGWQGCGALSLLCCARHVHACTVQTVTERG